MKDYAQTEQSEKGIGNHKWGNLMKVLMKNHIIMQPVKYQTTVDTMVCKTNQISPLTLIWGDNSNLFWLHS